MGRQGVRSGWDSVPGWVRAATDEMLGAEVVGTTGLVGGFSPGPAVRAELSDGRTVFIKAVGRTQNEHTMLLHRSEAWVLEQLPADVPAPGLLGALDTPDWVVLGVEWVDGHQPVASDPADVARLLDLLGRLAGVRADTLPDGLAPLARTHQDLFGHWPALAAGMDGAADRSEAADTSATAGGNGGAGADEGVDADRSPVGDAGVAALALDDWSSRHLQRLVELDGLAVEATAGDDLLHVDVRTDNVVLARDDPGRDVLVDWPGAAVGQAWVDLVALLPALHLDGGPPPQEALALASLPSSVDADAIDAFVVALAGYFTHNALLPAPPGLPTLRAFQAAQGRIARAWAAERLALR